jgi:methylated-DNA-protein-cysteine methyltransferase related protein
MAVPSFDQRVYAAVLQIPYGHLATYGQIAELIGAYGCARQVGWALRRLELPSAVPWHRVVNARGQVSMSLSREGSDWWRRCLGHRQRTQWGDAAVADGFTCRFHC